MLYQPINLTPSSFLGDGGGCIDVLKKNLFSLRLTGNSAVVAYQLNIMLNDTNGTLKYTSGKIVLANPVYPINYLGKAETLEIEVPESTVSGLVNGQNYKWCIKLWWGNTDNQSILSYEVTFVTKTTPYLSIINPPVQVNERNITLIAQYSQSENTPINWFRWRLYKEKYSTENLAKDTGEIYSQDIRLVFDGLLNNATYIYSVEVQTIDGIIVKTNLNEFKTSYTEIGTQEFLSVKCLKDEAAVNISWPFLVYIEGEPRNANYSYLDNTPIKDHTSINIESDNSITYKQTSNGLINFDGESTFIWSGEITSKDLTIFDVKAIGTDGVSRTLQMNYFETIENLGGGLYPQDTLYPGSTIYPKGDLIKWKAKFELACSGSIIFKKEYLVEEQSFCSPITAKNSTVKVVVAPDFIIISIKSSFKLWTDYIIEKYENLWPVLGSVREITIYGKQICDYFWIEKGKSNDETIFNIMNSEFEPSYRTKSRLCAKFNNNLKAGNMEEKVLSTSFTFYREEVGKNKLEYVCNVSNEVNSVTDYLVKNQTNYRYFMFPKNDKYLGSLISSEEIKTMWWSWALIAATEIYGSNECKAEAVYLFQGNVESGKISNNIQTNQLMNFTPYPIIQYASQNYKSATLGALIGKIDMENNKYVEPKELMNELMNLSNDGRRKFLKDRKGNLWEVAILPVNISVNDVSPMQEGKIEIEWAEIARVEDISVIRVNY
ncbi:MAG: hypothetical protein AB9836_04430 [Aminipila sp.]